MIWNDDGWGYTGDSLAYFCEYKNRIGPIVRVAMLNYYEDSQWVTYPFRIVGEMGEIWLSGCNAGFSGEGPRGSVTVLKELGYAEPYCNWPLEKAAFELGPIQSPVSPSSRDLTVPLTDAHEEILEVVREYRKVNDKMPTVKEIGKECELTGKHTVYMRLRELEDAGYIKRTPRKARSIELLD